MSDGAPLHGSPDREECERCTDFQPTFDSYESNLPDYGQIVLENVEGLCCIKCGEVRFPFEAISRAKQAFLASKLEVRPEQLVFMALLRGADIKPKKPIVTRFHFHKESFYLREFVTAGGHPEGVISDQFKPDWHGPTAVHLIQDLLNLEEKGFAKIEPYASVSEPGNTGYKYSITEEGIAVADRVVRNMPIFFKEAVARVDAEIHPMKLLDLEKKVHQEYPQFWLGSV